MFFLKKTIINNHGWGYIELIIALAIFLIALFPIINLLNGIVEGTQNRKIEFRATLIAQDFMEEIEQKKWDDKSTDPPTYVKLVDRTDAGALGPEGETYPNFDDIDDYHGYSFQPVPGFTCTATVTYVAVTLNDPVSDSGGVKTDYKQIKVEITWANKLQKTVIIKTIIANLALQGENT